MKLLVKRLKRLVAIMVILLLSTNTFATTNGPSGSDFVTKTEYDEIKKIFDSTMDTYQNGLNAKIDGAIAGYIGKMSSLSSGKGTKILSELQETDKFKFLVWQDPGRTLTGYQIMISGGTASQRDQSQDGWTHNYNVSNNTSSTTNNKVRYYQEDYLGYRAYIGIAYPAILTSWSISGTYYASNGSAQKIGSSTSNVYFTRTAPNTNTTTVTAQTYWTSNSPGGWTQKTGALIHGQTWLQKKTDDTQYYNLAASALSTSNTGFLKKENRNTDDGMECTTSNRYSLNQTVECDLGVNPSGSGVKCTWVESMPYWTVKTTDIAWTTLYNYTTVSQGYPVKLYEGIPLFSSPLQGEATFTLKFGTSSTSAQYLDFAISKNKFPNAVVAEGNEMSSVYPGYDSEDVMKELVNVKIARVRAGDYVKIKMDVEKDQIYYIKLMPRANATTTDVPAAGTYAYVDSIDGDISIVAN